jgi:hypothetical protein
MLSRRRYLLASAIPGSSALRGAYAQVRRGRTSGTPGMAPSGLGMRSTGPSTRMTTPVGPGAQARTLFTPITRAGGEGVLTRAGTARKRLCDRTASPAGPSPRPRLGATPNGRRRMTVPAGAAAEHPCGKNRSLCLTADRTASQPRARARSCPRRWRGLTDLPESASLPGPARLLVRARLPGQPPIHPRAMLPGQAGLPIQVSIPVPSRLLRGTSFLA